MSLLRKSTATSAAFGPFVNTTGVTLLSTKTIINGRSYKNGTPSAFAPASWATDTRGMYVVGMNTTHTDTTGRLRVSFATTGTGTYAWIPVWRDFDVGGTSGITLAAGQTSGYTLAAGQAPTSGVTLAGGQTAGITLASGQTSGYTLAAGQAPTSGITLAGGQTAGISLASGQTSGYSLIGGLVFTTAQTADAIWNHTTRTLSNTSGYTLAAGQVPTSGITLASGQTAGYSLIGGLVFTTGEIATGVWQWLDAPRTITGTAGYSLIEGLVFTTAEMADAVVQMIFAQSAGSYATAHAYSVVTQIADNAGGSALTTATIADATVRQMFTASAGAYGSAQAYSVVKQTADNAAGSALTTNAIAVGVWQYASGRTVTTSGITLAAGQTSGYTLAAGQVVTSGITLASGQTAGISLAAGQTSGYTLAAGQTSGYTLAAGQAPTSGITLAGGQTAGISLAGGQTSGYSLIGGLVFTTAQTADAVVKQMVTASAGAYSASQTYSIVKQIADNAGGSALTTATISGGVWQYATRTLTQTAAQVAAAVAGSDLAITKYVDFNATLNTTGDLSGRSRFWWTIKRNLNQDADSSAIVQVELTSGALYLNKAAATSASYGSLSITSNGTTWSVALFLDADAAALLDADRTDEYDLKMKDSAGAITQVTTGKAHVRDTATRATT